MGNSRYQFLLGMAYAGDAFGYLRGYSIPGIDTDEDKAAYWLLQSAKQNHSQAQYRLAMCYENGIGVEKDYAKAFIWYRISAANNDKDALIRLGDLYKQGVYEDTHTTPKGDLIYNLRPNLDSAIYCWNKAKELGNKQAIDRLEKIY